MFFFKEVYVSILRLLVINIVPVTFLQGTRIMFSQLHGHQMQSVL